MQLVVRSAYSILLLTLFVSHNKELQFKLEYIHVRYWINDISWSLRTGNYLHHEPAKFNTYRDRVFVSQHKKSMWSSRNKDFIMCVHNSYILRWLLSFWNYWKVNRFCVFIIPAFHLMFCKRNELYVDFRLEERRLYSDATLRLFSQQFRFRSIVTSKRSLLRCYHPCSTPQYFIDEQMKMNTKSAIKCREVFTYT